MDVPDSGYPFGGQSRVLRGGYTDVPRRATGLGGRPACVSPASEGLSPVTGRTICPDGGDTMEQAEGPFLVTARVAATESLDEDEV